MPGKHIYYEAKKLECSFECCFYQLSECQNTLENYRILAYLYLQCPGFLLEHRV